MTTYNVRLTYTDREGVKRQLIVAKPDGKDVALSGFARDYPAGRPYENNDVTALAILRDAGINPRAVVRERANPAEPLYTVQETSRVVGEDGEVTRRCLEVDLGELDADAIARLERQVVPDEGQVIYTTPVESLRELREPQLIDEYFTEDDIAARAFPEIAAVDPADPGVDDPVRRGAGAAALAAGDPGNLTAEQQQQAREAAFEALIEARINAKIYDEFAAPAGGGRAPTEAELADPARRQAAQKALIDELVERRARDAVDARGDEFDDLTDDQKQAEKTKARQALEKTVKDKQEETTKTNKTNHAARLKVVKKHATVAQRDRARPDEARRQVGRVVDALLTDGEEKAERDVLAAHADLPAGSMPRAVQFSEAADGSLLQRDGGALRPHRDVGDVDSTIRDLQRAHLAELAAARTLGFSPAELVALEKRQKTELQRVNLLGRGALLHDDRAAYEAHLRELTANRQQVLFHDPDNSEQTRLRPDDANFFGWFDPDKLMQDPVYKAKVEAIATERGVDITPDASGHYFGQMHANNNERMQVFSRAWSSLYNPEIRGGFDAAYAQVALEQFGPAGPDRDSKIAAAEREYQPAMLYRVVGYDPVSEQALTDLQRSQEGQVEKWVADTAGVDWVHGGADFPVRLQGINENGEPFEIAIDYDLAASPALADPAARATHFKHLWQQNYYTTTVAGEQKSYDDYSAEIDEQRVKAQRERTIDRWVRELEAREDPAAGIQLTYKDVSGRENSPAGANIAAANLRADCLDAEGKPDRAKLTAIWQREFNANALDRLRAIDRIRHPSAADMADLSAQVRAADPGNPTLDLNLPGGATTTVPYAAVVTDAGQPNLAGIRQAWQQSAGNLSEYMAGLPGNVREEVDLRARHAVIVEVRQEAQRRALEQSRRQPFTEAQITRFVEKAKNDLKADLAALQPAVESIRGVVRADAGCINLNRNKADGTRLVTDKQVDNLVKQVMLDHPEWIDRSGATPTISAVHRQNIADEVRTRYEAGLQAELTRERDRQIDEWRDNGEELDLGDGAGPRRADITDADGNYIITDEQLTAYWQNTYSEAALQRLASEQTDNFETTLTAAAEREVTARLRSVEDTADNVHAAEDTAVRQQRDAVAGMSDEDFSAYVRRKKQEELMAMQQAGVYFDEEGCLRNADGDDITAKFADTAIKAWGSKDQRETWQDILEFLEDNENPLMIGARLLIEIFYLIGTGMGANQATSEEGLALRKLRDPATLKRATQLAADSVYINDKGEARVDLKHLMENKDVERGDKVAVVVAALRRGFKPEEIEGISAGDPIMKQAKEVYQGYMQAATESAKGKATAEIDKDSRGPRTLRWFTRSGWLLPHLGRASADRKATQPMEAAQRQRDQSRRPPVRGRKPVGGGAAQPGSETRRRMASERLDRQRGIDDDAAPRSGRVGPRGGGG